MQRRAAAVSVAIFLLLAAGSYSLIGAAEQPELALENPTHSVAQNDTRTIGGTTYTFTDVGEDSATAAWTNESARYTATLNANDTVAYEGDNYTVVIPSSSDPTEFELREVQTVDRPTVEQNGTTYVVVEEDGEKRLVPRDEYLSEPRTYRFAEGDQFPYENETTTVAAVENESVTLEWFAPRTNELEFEEGVNTSIAGTNYLAHFVQDGGQNVLQLTTDYEDYHSDVEAQEFFHERMNGLWGVAILSALAAALLIMLAYLPSRY